jgi:hypothetical protein
MKKYLNFKNIVIVVLLIWVFLQTCNTGGIIPKKTVKIDGKKYEVIKYIIDTVEVEKVKVVTKKGKDIVYEVINIDTLVLKEFVDVDSAAILKDYLSKVIYKDTLFLPNSLGTVTLVDTITKNKILGRTFDAKVKQIEIKEIPIVKELPKNQVYYGFNGGFNKEDVVSQVGAGLMLKTKKDKLYQFGVGVTNRTFDGTNGSISPFINFGTYWKIKFKK